MPREILTENGSNFTLKLFKEVTKLFKIKHIKTSPYRPQSNGAVERMYHTLIEYLKSYVNDKQTNWDSWIPIAILPYNTSTHSSTNFTPDELLFGLPPTLPSSITQVQEFHYTFDHYLEELKLKLNRAHQIARENLLKSKEINKKIL